MAHQLTSRVDLWGFNVAGDCGPLTIYTTHDGRKVWYLRAPPKEPPSDRQTYRRDLFRAAAAAWQLLSAEARARWELATHRGSMPATGYNLFTWWHLVQDVDLLATISRNTGVPLP